jgi:predicted transcriptional regulator
MVEAIAGFATLAGSLVSVLDEPRLKALCFLKISSNGASFSDIERAMNRQGGAVALALERLMQVGIIEKIGLPSNPIYRLTSWGHVAFSFCSNLVRTVRMARDPPPYLDQRQFERAKELADIFEAQLARFKFREERIARL